MADELELDRFNIRKKARLLGVMKDDDGLPMVVFMVNPNDSIGWEIDKTRIAANPKYREMVAAQLASLLGQDHESAYDLLFGDSLKREGYRR